MHGVDHDRRAASALRRRGPRRPGEVFHRHHRQRWCRWLDASLLAGAECVPDLKASDGANPNEAAVNAVHPCFGIQSRRQTRVSRLVDRPHHVRGVGGDRRHRGHPGPLMRAYRLDLQALLTPQALDLLRGSRVRSSLVAAATGSPGAEVPWRRLYGRRCSRRRAQRSAYVGRGDVAEVDVPATLQATIAARIDRLDPRAKQTLSAAAVIGPRFSPVQLGNRPGPPQAGQGGTYRSGEGHPAGRICVSPAANPVGGLRVTTEVRPRRIAPPPGRRDRTACPGISRRERGVDRRASGGGWWPES